MGEGTMADQMTALLTNIGTFFTQAVTWLGAILDEITGNPALLILVIAMPVIGFSVGLLKRLMGM